MVRIINQDIYRVIQYLNTMYRDIPDVTLHIIEDCDTIDTETGVGFGVYNTETSEIYVAGDLPEVEYVVSTILHEFAHHLQHVRKRPFDEDFADQFSESIMKQLGYTI